MTFFKKFVQFCNENVVMISGVSIIVGIHWAWLKLQDVPTLVHPDEKKELPLLIGARKLKEMAETKINELTDRGPKNQ